MEKDIRDLQDELSLLKERIKCLEDFITLKRPIYFPPNIPDLPEFIVNLNNILKPGNPRDLL